MADDAYDVTINIKAEVKHLPALIEFSRLYFEGVLSVSEKSYLVYSLQLIIAEACTNVMRHAYRDTDGGRLELAFKVVGDEAVIRVSDRGRPYNPSEVPDPDLDQPKGHGLGLFIIRQFVDSFQYDSRDGQNVLTLVKRIDAAAAQAPGA
jgi:serine/threonine-protein kinase RsbW